MEEFKEYLRFPDIEKATDYTSVLDKHKIPFQLDDVPMRFKLVSTDSPWDNQFILKLKESDFAKAEGVFNSEVDNDVKQLTSDHYLYTFADNDIIDVIANQNEWTKAEVKLATQIAHDRNLDLTAISMKAAKKIPENNPKAKLTI